VVDRIGWSEEKGFKDLEGMEERFNLLVMNISTQILSPYRTLFSTYRKLNRLFSLKPLYNSKQGFGGGFRF
jgi:hypothetical protein